MYLPLTLLGLLVLACAAEDPQGGGVATAPVDSSLPTATASGSDSAIATGSVPPGSTTAPIVSTAPTSSAAPTAAPSATTPAIAPEDVPLWADVYWMINNTCGRFICHVSPGGFPPDLSDAQGDLHVNLMTTTVVECGGDPLVTPGDPTRSAILKLVKRECGALFMPQDCVDPVCIPDTDVQMLSDWIAGGAPQ